MKPVREVVSRDVIEDLWGAGYTILPRKRHPDPFHLPQEMVPHGRFYQWWHLVSDKCHFERADGNSGWAPVPASRHDGYFMPAGHVGSIEVQGLGLFEKSKFEVDQELASNTAKAHKQVADWADKAASHGLSGGFSMNGMVTEVGDSDVIKDALTKTVNTRVALPPDMLPHMGKVFAQRDRLYDELVTAWNAGAVLTDAQDAIRKRYQEAEAEDPEILKGPTLNALLLPAAIEIVRERIGPTPMQTKLNALKERLKKEASDE